ncbi:hypothetical protein Esti_001797 [Eimeria stiedai]
MRLGAGGDLQRYLRSHGAVLTDSAAYNLLRRLDSNGNGRISYSEFLDFVLPTEAAERNAVLSRDRQISSFHTTSSCCCCCYSAEGTHPCCSSSNDACVSQLLLREVNAHRELEVQKKVLAASPDFKLLAAFQFVEDPKIAAVTPTSLAESLEGDGFFLRPAEVELIFRRLDRDSDGRLKYLEFVEAVVPSTCSAPLLTSDSLSLRLFEHAVLERAAPLSPFKELSVARAAQAAQENRRSSLLCSNVCKVRSKSCSGNAVAGGSQIDSERRLECLREKLALKPDFNLLQFWGLFDTEGRGYAAATHVRDAFNAIGLNISLSQALLFARKLNSDAEPRIRYADMARAFLPTKTRYAEAMINRISNGSHKCRTPQRHLAPETLDIVAAIFDMTLTSEEQAELSRHRMCFKDLYSAFQDLDRDGDGYITAAEFSASLMAHGVCPSEAELNALVNRYDKNGDSKVSYNEFVNEIGRTRCPVGSCRLVCLCR